MHQIRIASVVLSAVLLASCGGGASDVPAKPSFASQVSFGDSLSDVGSYNVGAIAALGGGQFTINIPGTPTNWTEMTAPMLGLSQPCAAQTGIDNGSGAAPGTPVGMVVPVTNNTACTAYAQGGARVTSQPGIGNKLLGGGGFALTVPVVTQIANHLAANGGTFNGNEIVFVMAGANDVFYQAGLVGAAAITSAQAAAAMQTAATELATAVKNEIVGKGAKYVVVVNIPDMGTTPYVAVQASPAATKALLDALVSAFNTQLAADLPDSATVLNIDANTASHDEVTNPSKYNLTNVTGTACNLSFGVNPLSPSAGVPGSSLVCKASNLTAGVSVTDHYMFADLVHPTPYAHSLFALYVLQAMTNKGWY
ncbi:MAG: SGNH/GDSL hydrolase family protein [Sideroxydans sp.]|nr:SGNH/GDSL hydrolase family protein [Sideroxydans sp.]